MKRMLIFAPVLLIGLAAVFILGTGVDGAAAATVTRYQQNASQLSYSGSWTVRSAAAASNGSYRYANANGASVTVTFSGTRLAWIVKKSPSYGIANVSLDGGSPVDLYNGTTVYQQKAWETDTLDAGLHTVDIQWTGTRNAAATGTNIGVDAFDVTGTLLGVTRVQQTDQHLGWTGKWTKVSSTSYSGGNAWYANSAGSTVTVEFDGTSLTLLGKKGPTYGIVNVAMDGGPPVPVDLYNPTIIYQQKFWSSGSIAYGHHVVKLEWTRQEARSGDQDERRSGRPRSHGQPYRRAAFLSCLRLRAGDDTSSRSWPSISACGTGPAPRRWRPCSMPWISSPPSAISPRS